MERYLADETIDIAELGHALAQGIDGRAPSSRCCAGARPG